MHLYTNLINFINSQNNISTKGLINIFLVLASTFLLLISINVVSNIINDEQIAEKEDPPIEPEIEFRNIVEKDFAILKVRIKDSEVFSEINDMLSYEKLDTSSIQKATKEFDKIKEYLEDNRVSIANYNDLKCLLNLRKYQFYEKINQKTEALIWLDLFLEKNHSVYFEAERDLLKATIDLQDGNINGIKIFLDKQKQKNKTLLLKEESTKNATDQTIDFANEYTPNPKIREIDNCYIDDSKYKLINDLVTNDGRVYEYDLIEIPDLSNIVSIAMEDTGIDFNLTFDYNKIQQIEPSICPEINSKPFITDTQDEKGHGSLGFRFATDDNTSNLKVLPIKICDNNGESLYLLNCGSYSATLSAQGQNMGGDGFNNKLGNGTSYPAYFASRLRAMEIASEPTNRSINSLNNYFNEAGDTGKTYALLVGINNYKNVKDLHYSINDLNLIEETLKNNYPTTQNKLDLTILKNNEATKQNILSALYNIRTKANPDDNILIYYVGHGISKVDGAINQEIVASQLVNNTTSQYILPYDFSYQKVDSDLSIDEIKELFKDTNTLNPPLIVVDACRTIGGIENIEVTMKESKNHRSNNTLALEKRFLTDDWIAKSNYRSTKNYFYGSREESCEIETGDYIYDTPADPSNKGSLNELNVTCFGEQWYLNNTAQLNSPTHIVINGLETWGITTKNPLVSVAILDTGIDWTPEDLVNNIWQNLGEDADGDGQLLIYKNGNWIFDHDDDCSGYADDFVSSELERNFENYLLDGFLYNLGQTPINGGTMMSYCIANTDIGINFFKGFGAEPGDLIRRNVNGLIKENHCQALQNTSHVTPQVEYNANLDDLNDGFKSDVEWNEEEDLFTSEKLSKISSKSTKPKLIVLNATTVGDQSVGLRTINHGLFTYNLAKSLNKKSGVDLNNDQFISLQESQKDIDKGVQAIKNKRDDVTQQSDLYFYR